jgi:hypothetical protein
LITGAKEWHKYQFLLDFSLFYHNNKKSVRYFKWRRLVRVARSHVMTFHGHPRSCAYLKHCNPVLHPAAFSQVVASQGHPFLILRKRITKLQEKQEKKTPTFQHTTSFIHQKLSFSILVHTSDSRHQLLAYFLLFTI